MEGKVKIERLLIWAAVLTAVCLAGETGISAETIATKDYWVLTDGYRGMFSNGGRITVSYGPCAGYIAKDVFDVAWPGSTGTSNQFSPMSWGG